MKIRFDAMKAVEAAAVIARAEGKRIGRLRLLKLLYIADRKALKQRGRPIIGAKIVAMDNGPLHSDIYNLVKGDHPKTHLWSKYFTNVGRRDVELTEEPVNLALSKDDIEILQSVAEEFASMNDWKVVELTHEFPEWDEVYQEGTSRIIDFESIVKHAGREDDLPSIVQDMTDSETFDRFFEDAT